MLHKIKSSLFGRKHTQSNKVSKEIRRWAEVEFSKDVEYALHMMTNKSYEELMEATKK